MLVFVSYGNRCKVEVISRSDLLRARGYKGVDMSDIIIEGKNLNDINQSNFQTVGVRSGFHFIQHILALMKLSVDESGI